MRWEGLTCLAECRNAADNGETKDEDIGLVDVALLEIKVQFAHRTRHDGRPCHDLDGIILESIAGVDKGTHVAIYSHALLGVVNQVFRRHPWPDWQLHAMHVHDIDGNAFLEMDVFKSKFGVRE